MFYCGTRRLRKAGEKWISLIEDENWIEVSSCLFRMIWGREFGSGVGGRRRVVGGKRRVVGGTLVENRH
jgi:hypothetical protein